LRDANDDPLRALHGFLSPGRPDIRVAVIDVRGASFSESSPVKHARRLRSKGRAGKALGATRGAAR
jgi:hypothetical protein